MTTNEEQACGACGEPASIHPIDGPNGVLKCGVYVEPGRDLKRLRLAVKAAPKRPTPTPEQERALGRRQAISDRIQENLAQRKALFAAGAEADAECPEWDRLAPNALVDIDAITYGLGTCEAFLPRELSDDRKRRWHLVVDPSEKMDGFMIFREPSDPYGAPSEELLALLRGRKDFGNIVAREAHPVQAEPSPRELVAAIALDGRISLTPEAASLLGVVRGGHTVFDLIDRALDIAKERDQERARGRRERDEAERAAHTDGEHRAKWSSSFRDIVVELFPDSADEVMQPPLEDAVTTCLERIKSLRRGEQGIVKASMEIAERSRQIARALDVSAATPWNDLVTAVAIRAAAFLRLPDVESALDEAFRMRDEAIAKLESLTVKRDRPLRPLRTLCIGCHDVFNITQNRCPRCTDASRREPAQPALTPPGALEQLGAALGYGGKEMSGRTWDSLLADVRNLAEERDQLKARVERGEQFWDRSIDLCDVLNVDRTTSWDDLIRTVVVLKNAARESGAQLAEIKAELVATRGKVEVQPRFATHVLLEERLAKLERMFDGWGPNEMLFGKVSDPEAQLQHEAQARHLGTLDALIKSVEARLADVEARIGQPGPLDALEARLDVLAETHERWKITVDALSARVTELHKHHENNAVESQRRDEALTERIDALEAWQRAATERPVAETNHLRPGKGALMVRDALKVGDWVIFSDAPRRVHNVEVGAVVLDIEGRGIKVDSGVFCLVWRPEPQG